MPRSARNHDCSSARKISPKISGETLRPTSPLRTNRPLPQRGRRGRLRNPRNQPDPDSTHFKIKLPSLYKAILTRSLLSSSKFTWQSIVHWPQVAPQERQQRRDVRPTALRLYRSDDKPEEPEHRVYDVYEGY